MSYLISYLVVVNLFAIASMKLDKAQAKKKKYRIPEKALLEISLMGGALGVFLSMRLFHHKTRKIKFTLIIPLLILIQISIIYILLWQNIL